MFIKKIGCVAVLAGGMSKRMGLPKPFVEIKGVSMIDVVLMKLSLVVNKFLVVTNRALFNDMKTHFENFNGSLTLLKDEVEGMGPIGGIYTAFLHSSDYHILVVGCDMPLVSPELAICLYDKREKFHIVVPESPGGIEPLFAVYSRDCMEDMEGFIAEGKRSLHEFISCVDALYLEPGEVKKYDPDFLSFVNVNTQEDLKMVERMLI